MMPGKVDGEKYSSLFNMSLQLSRDPTINTPASGVSRHYSKIDFTNDPSESVVEEAHKENIRGSNDDPWNKNATLGEHECKNLPTARPKTSI